MIQASLFALFFLASADPCAPGPYRVGAMTIDFVDESRANRLLRTEIWYPTHATEALVQPKETAAEPPVPAARPKPILVGKHTALRDVPVAEGKFPWIVFSHGLLAVREQSTFLTEHLASHGFIIVSADHQYNTARDFRPKEVYQSGIDRPKDVAYLIDHMIQKNQTPGDPLEGRFDVPRLAVMGHSYGGYTALAVGGAVVDVEAMARRTNLSLPEEGVDFADSRPRAIIAYAPVGPPVFAPAGLAHLQKPTLVFGGTIDDVTPLEQHQLPIFRYAGGPCILATIEGGTHYSFNNAELSRLISMFIKDRPMISRAESDAMIFRVTMAFLERYLLESTKWRDYLVQTVPGLAISVRNIPEIKAEVRK